MMSDLVLFLILERASSLLLVSTGSLAVVIVSFVLIVVFILQNVIHKEKPVKREWRKKGGFFGISSP